MNTRPHAMITFLLLSLLTSVAARVPERKVNQLGEILEEDRVFYRWQSTTSGNALVQAGGMTRGLNKYFMKFVDGNAAGAGLYMAGTPNSSSAYLPEAGGNLIEVRIPKGTRVIDLMDLDTLDEMKRLGMRVTDLHDRIKARGTVLKYNSDWYVGKNLNEGTRFDLYPTKPVTAEDVAKQYRLIQEPKSQKQMIEQLKARQPGVVAELTREPRFFDVAIHAATPAEAVHALRERITQPLTPVEMRHLGTVAVQRPDVVAAAMDDQRLNAWFVKQMRKALGTSAHGEFQSSAGSLPILRAVMDAPGVAEAERQLAAKNLVRVAMADPGLRRSPADLARTLLPIVPRVDFTPGERTAFTVGVKNAVGEFERSVTPAPGWADLVRAARVDDPALHARIENLAERRALIDAAVRDGDSGRLARAFAAAPDARQVEHTVNELARHLPDAEVNAALGRWAAARPDDLARLFDAPDDVPAGLRLAIRAGGDHLQEATYRAAVGRNPAGRVPYFVACVQDDACRSGLAARVRADGGRLFAGNHDFYSVVDGLRGIAAAHPRAARDLASAILSTTESPATLLQYAGVMQLIGADADIKKMVVAAARARGLNTFRTEEILELRHYASPSPLVQRELLRAAADAAVRPEEVISIGHAARKMNGGGLDLSVRLSRRLTELGGGPADAAAFKQLKLIGPAPKSVDVGTPDCLRDLVRLVRM